MAYLFYLDLYLFLLINDRKNIRCFMHFLEYLFLMLVKLMIILNSQYNLIKLTYSIIPIFFYFLTRCIIYKLEKYDSDCSQVLDLLIIGFRLYILIQTITIFLKLDKQLSWNWKEVLLQLIIHFDILYRDILFLLK